MIDMAAAARLLTEARHIVFLTHANPDGDTLGCAFALAQALAEGRHVQVLCPDTIGESYHFMGAGLPEEPIPAGSAPFVVAVDVADICLLGDLRQVYENKIDLCIDHHGSNRLFAKHTLLEPEAAATAELVYRLLLELGADITHRIADCLFAGISIDTGCFRYANTTAQSHRIAAELIGLGARAAELNQIFFETKTRSYIALEHLAMDSLRFYFDGLCALIWITQEMYQQSGSHEAETDHIASRPRQIEGVFVGATLKERPDGSFRASLRTRTPLDAAAICGRLGGGGHVRAAGCTIKKPRPEAEAVLLEAIRAELESARLVGAE